MVECNIVQIYWFPCSNILVSLFRTFEKMLGAMKNCGKWYDMVAVKLPETVS